MDLNVKIENYRDISKGAFKGTFTLILEPLGILIAECKYFTMNGKVWFKFPDKEYKKAGDEKSSYFTLIKILDKSLEKVLENKVLNQLEEIASNPPQRSYTPRNSGVPF